MLSDHTVLLPVSGNLSSDLDDETVVLDADKGVYYGMNPVAAFIWHQISSPTTVGAVKEAVMNEFEVDEETCSRDLHHLLSNLLTSGLIEVRRDAA